MMSTHDLPLNTWIVIEQHSSWQYVAFVSQHDTQAAAEGERDRRNKLSFARPYRAFLLLEPIAQRMGGHPGPARTHHRSLRVHGR
jgi:hypothetical protein